MIIIDVLNKALEKPNDLIQEMIERSSIPLNLSRNDNNTPRYGTAKDFNGSFVHYFTT